MADVSIYPNDIDGYAQIPLVVDTVTKIDAVTVNRLRDAIIKIETELGALPSGTFENVKLRLEDLDSKLSEYQDHANLSNIEWNLGGHTGTANFLAGFDGLGAAVNVDPATVGTLDHTQLNNIIWNTSGHTGTANFLAGFDGSGNPTDIDPNTIGTTDHTQLTNIIWAAGGHTGTANFLAGFDGSGNPTSIDPTTVGGSTLDLAAVLSNGNTTGGTDIIISSGDEVTGVDGATGTDLIIRPGNGSAGNDGALHLGTATGSVAGNPRGENAVDFQRHRGGPTQVASGKASFIAAGYGNTASGDYSFASGYGCTAIGKNSHVQGYGTTAYDGAHAEGSGTTAYGKYSHAEGYGTTTYAKYSHAEGFQSITGVSGQLDIGKHSHAEGQQTSAIARGSHAEGIYTTAGYWMAPWVEAIGVGSHAEGISTVANGYASHAEGYATGAYGSASHAEGTYSQVSSDADSGHAEGWGTRCLASFAHAGGRFSIADVPGQFARASDDFSATASGKGGSQLSLFHAGERTTNSTTTNLQFYDSRLVLRSEMTYGFRLIVTARQTGGIGTVGDSATWTFYGQIKRDNLNNTALDGLWVLQTVALTDEAITVLTGVTSSGAETPSFSSAGAGAWTIQVTADDANEALQIAATGEDDKNIVWSASIFTAEAGVGQNV